MAKDIPLVRQAIVQDPFSTGPNIPLDTPEWFAWLDAPTTTRFSYAMHNRSRGYIDGFMTVIKEKRQRGGSYWSVYRRMRPHLRKVYLGPSQALTCQRLEQIVTRLRGPPIALYITQNVTQHRCRLAPTGISGPLFTWHDGRYALTVRSISKLCAFLIVVTGCFQLTQ